MELSLLYPPEWVQYARCGGDPDPDRFFPDADDRDEDDLAGLTERQRRTIRRKRREAVRAFCNGCRVQQECLNYALENDEPVGMWGGLTRQERDALRRGTPAASVAGPVTDEQLIEAAYKHETYQQAAASLGMTRDEYLDRVKAAGLWSWWNRPFTPHEASLVFTDRREMTLEELARQLQRSRAQIINALQTRRRQLRRQARQEKDNGQ